MTSRIAAACSGARHGVDLDVEATLQLVADALLGVLVLVEDLARTVERLEAEPDYLRRR